MKKNVFYSFSDMNKIKALLVTLIFLGCEQKKAVFTAMDLFEAGVSSGEVNNKKIREASGLVKSISNPGLFWTHNDSGNKAELFLINKSGEIVSTVTLENVKNRDWEDITVGPGPEAGKNYIYVGEIGDNNAIFKYKFIYRIEEPVLHNTKDTTITVVDKIKFKLSDKMRDTEALMIDPLTKDLFIFSKLENKVNLYKLDYPQSTTEATTAERILSNLPLTMIVAADISKDGTEILAKDYNHMYYWKREKDEGIETAIKRLPTRLPYEPEPQGEAIAFDDRGAGYYTLSEKKEKMPQHLLFYKRK